MTCVDVFRLPFLLQSKGGGQVNSRYGPCSLAIQPKRNECGCKRRRERKRVVRKEGKSHGSLQIEVMEVGEDGGPLQPSDESRNTDPLFS